MQAGLELALLSSIVGLIGVVTAVYLASWVLRQDPGPENVRFISEAIATGARAYLFRQYRYLAVVLVVLAAIIGGGIYAVSHAATLGALSAVAFVVGALGSMMAGYLGMYVTTRSASRAAVAAYRSVFDSLRVAWRAGSVMGLSLAGTALLLISVLYIAFTHALPEDWALALVSMAFGASLVTLFMRVGGGIYTKAADLGADLVGKVERGIPEDDPRNPGVIADNVGDNVGDVAGMAADVFESYIVIMTGTIFLAWVIGWYKPGFVNLVVLPLVYGALALLATLIGVFILRLRVGEHPLSAISKDIYETIGISVVLFFAASYFLLRPLGALVALLSPLAASLGAIVAPVVLAFTGYYTHYTYRPVKEIARQATISPATVIVTGYAYGLLSAIPVILLIVFVLGLTYLLGYVAFKPIIGAASMGPYSGLLAGIYGTALASVGLLSVAGIIITADSFGPVSDNAAGVAEMSGMPDEIRERLDVLDAVGNTTKATTKGYAISSAALAALVLFVGFIFEVISISTAMFNDIDAQELLSSIMVINPNVLLGALVGAVVVYFLASRTLNAVGVTAMEIVEEIRRQFRERPGILEWKEKPDYARVVDIATRRAIQEFMAPVLVAIVAPIVTGLVLGWQAVAGLIAGAILVGVPRALLMANAGGAWDNAKKYIESGQYGGKGSEAHKAAVIGDTVGDPFKDTTGPSMNPLIKVLNTLSVVFAPMIVAANGALGAAVLLHGLLAL